MSNEKEKLEQVMQRIKSILVEADIAASIVLTTPKIDADPFEFVTIKYDHLDTSFSYAKSIRNRCANGILIEGSLQNGFEDPTVQKFLRTVGMFKAILKGAIRTEKTCEEVIETIMKVLIDKKQATTVFQKHNMN